MNCAIYIASCDAYSDLWTPCLTSWRKHWPACPYPMFLGSEAKICHDEHVCTLLSTSSDWSEGVRQHLSQLKTEYVLFTLDDFFLRRTVNGETITRFLAVMDDNPAISMVRLIPRPPPQKAFLPFPELGESLSDHSYRICTQAALWRRRDLIALLVPGENIWEFENNVQRRAEGNGKAYLTTWSAALPYRGFVFHHVVEKGKWIPTQYALARIRRLGVSPGARPIMGPLQFSLLAFAEIVNAVLAKLYQGDCGKARARVRARLPAWLAIAYARIRKYPPPKGIGKGGCETGCAR